MRELLTVSAVVLVVALAVLGTARWQANRAVEQCERLRAPFNADEHTKLAAQLEVIRCLVSRLQEIQSELK